MAISTEANSPSAGSLQQDDTRLCVSGASFLFPNYIPESAWLEHAPFAFWLVDVLRPSCLVELGTHHGFSFFAFCQAVKELGLAAECHGIDTWRGDEHAGFYGEDVFETVNAIQKERYPGFAHLHRCYFDEALSDFPDESIDVLHIDGRHTYEDARHDFESWRSKLSPSGVVLFHDTQVRDRGFGVFRLWAEASESWPNFEFVHGHGLGVLGVGPKVPPRLRPLFERTAIEEEAIRGVYGRLGRAVSMRRELDAIHAQHAELRRFMGEQALEQKNAHVELKGAIEHHAMALDAARGELLSQQRAADSRVSRLELQSGRLHRSLQVLRAELMEQTNLLTGRRDGAPRPEPNQQKIHIGVKPEPSRSEIPSLVDRTDIMEIVSPPLSSKCNETDSVVSMVETPFIHTRLSELPMIRRACIFSFYDPHGIVDDYVVFLLQKLGEFADTILFYSNGPLSRESEIKLKGVVTEIIIRLNVGFDVLAYKEGLERIDYNRAGLYDEVLMVNHTCYGPVFPFSELFGEMDSRDCDFWGVSAHAEMTPNPLTGVGTLPYHLNANFIAVRAGMLGSSSFRHYWEMISVTPSYEGAIMSHEARFTKYFSDLGYKVSSYLDKRSYGSHYPLMINIDETLIDRNPLIKRRAFFHDPRFFEHNGADLPRALSIMAEKSEYKQELIWRNVIRQAELRVLNTNAALTSILPDVRIKHGESVDYGGIAVCVHIFYTDMLDEIFAHTDTIPAPYDFIATTDSEEKRAFIERSVAGQKNVRNIIVRVVEQNRGRDMSALFITCRDLFLDDRYSLVCRLHTKRSPQVESARGNLFKRHMFENLLNSEGYTTNVLDMFQDRPWIGVAVPPLVQISYGAMGHAWYANRQKAEEIKKILDLKVHFDPDTPIAAYGTMFWFRPAALRKLFSHPWKWTDYNAEPMHVDGGLAHAQERLICYVAQDAGFTTEQILSSHLAGWNYAMMEYKLQKLAAALPVAHFGYHCHLLEQWRDAGYPLSHAVAAPPAPLLPPLPPSVTRSLRELRYGIKKHLRQFERDVLRPIFHAVSLRGLRRN